MKNLLLILLILMVKTVCGQSSDTTDNFTIQRFSKSYNLETREKERSLHFNTEKQKRYVGQDNVVLSTYGLTLTAIENEILDQEVKERNAMIKRDSMALKGIWLRDYTLDEPANELMNSRTRLPFYVSLTRMVDNFQVVGNLIFTSGHGVVVKLKSSG